jgi:hypothetical protein
MPAKIQMTLTNSNIAFQTRQLLQSNPIQTISKATSLPLNTAMINRVHMSRPGCGSCGGR